MPCEVFNRNTLHRLKVLIKRAFYVHKYVELQNMDENHDTKSWFIV